MSVKRKLLQWTLVYLLILAGYLYLYVIDVDRIIYPGREAEEVKSKVDFVYQAY